MNEKNKNKIYLSKDNLDYPVKSISIVKAKINKPIKAYRKKAKTSEFEGISKYFVPLQKEWDNSIYTYKHESLKTLRSTDKSTFTIVKNYLNFYNLKIEKTARSIRARRRKLRNSIGKILVGKPNFKHTNDSLVIIIYYYNRRLIYFLNKMNSENAINNLTIRSYTKFVENVYNKVEKMSTLISKLRVSKGFKTDVLLKKLKKNYLIDLTKKFFQNEVNSLLLKQVIFLDRFKTNKFYLLPLLTVLENTYKKKIILNLINIKYIHNSPSVTAEGIITKLKKRINPPLAVLRNAIDTFHIPIVDRLALYDDMFKRKKKLQNKILKRSLFADNTTNAIDNLEKFLYKWKNNLVERKNTKTNINNVIKSLKYKFTSGVRYEIAGRLTKRYVAQRSIYKLVYKGNIRNTDSSKKGLSTTLVRGYAKSNVLFKQSKSKRRIGAFGLKTWISSNK